MKNLIIKMKVQLEVERSSKIKAYKATQILREDFHIHLNLKPIMLFQEQSLKMCLEIMAFKISIKCLNNNSRMQHFKNLTQR